MDVALVFGIVGVIMSFLGIAGVVCSGESHEKAVKNILVFVTGMALIILFADLRIQQTVKKLIPISITISK